jgi:hypothetical protein
MVEDVIPDEELSIYVERMIRFLHLLCIHDLVFRLPDNAPANAPQASMHWTMLSVIYSFFYSLIEKDKRSIDFFRIWRAREPAYSSELDNLEARIAPHKEALRLFRNRFGFHGSTTRAHEASGLQLLDSDAKELWAIILDLRNLSTKLIASRLKRQGGLKREIEEAAVREVGSLDPKIVQRGDFEGQLERERRGPALNDTSISCKLRTDKDIIEKQASKPTRLLLWQSNSKEVCNEGVRACPYSNL